MAKSTNWTPTAYLLLGTNLGDRHRNLGKALEEICKLGKLMATSGIYRSAPWGITDQPEFLNQAVALNCGLQPLQLLDALKSIEHRMGRKPGERWAERLIDIDILYIGHEKFDDPALQVPHPQIASRRFALMPLEEIAPDFVDPSRGITINRMLEDCTDPLAVERLT